LQQWERRGEERSVGGWQFVSRPSDRNSRQVGRRQWGEKRRERSETHREDEEGRRGSAEHTDKSKTKKTKQSSKHKKKGIVSTTKTNAKEN